ncbi:MAG: peptidase C11, partial [Clostridia bacterium]|nr:peptidase C11 [Clostridia bacterium]
VDTLVDGAARSKFTTLKGNGQDKVTLMLYLIGSDLESQSGMATSDLNEILHADLTNENLNIIVQTGGTKRWANNVMSSRNIERWQATSRGLSRMDTLRSADMTKPEVLSSFIQYAAKAAPADRYMLILWDHGGGSVTGYGRDELYPNGTMDTAEVAKALKAGGVKFDFVGFDACLMATLENAMALEPYADYLIASEESEPGTGWYYTNWLSDLSANTSTSTLQLGKRLLDDFTSKSASAMSGYYGIGSYGAQTTLSLIDLAELHGTLPEALTNFGNDLQATLTSDHFQDVATARSSSKEFAASSRLDQVDVVDFCKKLGSDKATALANVVQNAVKYNRANGISDSYGLSMYFPNSNLRYMNAMTSIYDEIGMDEAFTGSVKQYATLESSGQIASNSSGSSLFDLLTGGQYYNYSGSSSPYVGSYSGSTGSYTVNDFYNMLGQNMTGNSGYYTTGGSQYGATDFQSILGGNSASWMTDSMIRVAASALSNRALTPAADFKTVQKDGKDVLALTDEQWAEIKAAEVNVFVPDTNNGGWLDLGLDNTGKYNEDGDLIDEWTGNWITLDGNFAAIYPISDLDEDGDGKYITTKYIPAQLNGERVNIIVEFNEETGRDSALGAERVYDVDVEAKGLLAIEAGDRIQLLCDHYDESGDVKEEYSLGNAFTVGSEGLSVYSRKVSNTGCVYSYRLTDLFGAFHWLPVKTN